MAGKKRIWMAALVVLLVAAGVGVFALVHKTSAPPEKAPSEQTGQTDGTKDQSSASDVMTVQPDGTFDPNEMTDVSGTWDNESPSPSGGAEPAAPSGTTPSGEIPGSEMPGGETPSDETPDQSDTEPEDDTTRWGPIY